MYILDKIIIKIHLWNVYNIDNDGYRTNNSLEGWHRHMNKSLPNKPNLWKFINSIKTEHKVNQVDLLRIQNGIQIGFNQNNHVVRRNNNLNRIKLSYQNDQITTMQYIHALLENLPY
jgi:hypothetical protein